MRSGGGWGGGGEATGEVVSPPSPHAPLSCASPNKRDESAFDRLNERRTGARTPKNENLSFS